MPTMTGAEHLAWCKQRAIAELDADPSGAGPANACTSMTSDTSKHPDTAGHQGNFLFAMQLAGGFLHTPEQVREFIEGYR